MLHGRERSAEPEPLSQFANLPIYGYEVYGITDTSFVRKASPQIWAQKRKSDEFELLELREIFKLILLSCGVELE